MWEIHTAPINPSRYSDEYAKRAAPMTVVETVTGTMPISHCLKFLKHDQKSDADIASGCTHITKHPKNLLSSLQFSSSTDDGRRHRLC